MGIAFLHGHGSRMAGDRLGQRMTAQEARSLQERGAPLHEGTWVWVPPWVHRVAFYADFDHKLLAAIGPAVLNVGDIAPLEEYAFGAEIPNYFMTPEPADWMAAVASVSSLLPGQLYLVGTTPPVDTALVWLCTMPWVCNTLPPEQGHDEDCQGLFRRLENASELHLLSCRGIAKQPQQPTRELLFNVPATSTLAVPSLVEGEVRRPPSVNPYGDSPTAYADSLRGEIGRILTWATTDPQAALAYVESLPQATQASLRSYGPGFGLWLEHMRHPMEASAPEAQVIALITLIVEGWDDDPAATALTWRAFPAASRRAVMPALRQAAILEPNRDTRDTIRMFLAAIGDDLDTIADQLVPAAPHGTLGSPPDTFVEALENPAWRNAFWRYARENWSKDIPIDALLALRELLRPATEQHMPAGGVLPIRDNPKPHGLPNELDHIADLVDFFTAHWNPSHPTLAPVVEDVHSLWRQLATAARTLGPFNPATPSHMDQYRRLHAENINPDYTPPAGFDPDHPDPDALAANAELSAWTWAHNTRDYIYLTLGEQQQISAWVYDTDPAVTLSFDELSPEHQAEFTAAAEAIRQELTTATDTLLAELYHQFRQQLRSAP